MYGGLRCHDELGVLVLSANRERAPEVALAREHLLCEAEPASKQTCSVTSTILDTTGLNCPLPFLKLRKALRDLLPGSRIEVLSTDPLAPGDFRELCAALGHHIESSREERGVTYTLIEVKAARPL